MSEETETEGEKEASSAPRKRLFRRDWDQIISLAKEGVEVEKIAKTFKVSKAAIYQGLKRHGIKVGVYTPTAEQAAISKSQQELLDRIKETKDRDYRFTDALQTRIMKVITDTEKAAGAGKPASYRGIIDDIKALKLALDGVKVGTANKWMILGLDKDNAETDRELPELPIRELTPAEIAAIRARQEAEAEGERQEAGDDLDDDLNDIIEEGEDDEAAEFGGGNDK